MQVESTLVYLGSLAVLGTASAIYLYSSVPRGVESPVEIEKACRALRPYRFLVLSDTHASREDEVSELLEILENARDKLGATGIIHCGDFTSPRLVSELNRMFAQAVFVRGNMDGRELEFLPRSKEFQMGCLRIGVFHEIYTRRRMRKLARDRRLDILIFGHTHVPFLRREDGRIFLNPGSPTRPRFSKPTIGLLEIDGGVARAEILEVDRLR